MSESDVTTHSASNESARRRDVELAKEILRGPTARTSQEVYDLAGRLKDVNEFAYARRLLGSIRNRAR